MKLGNYYSLMTQISNAWLNSQGPLLMSTQSTHTQENTAMANITPTERLSRHGLTRGSEWGSTRVVSGGRDVIVTWGSDHTPQDLVPRLTTGRSILRAFKLVVHDDLSDIELNVEKMATFIGNIQ